MQLLKSLVFLLLLTAPPAFAQPAPTSHGLVAAGRMPATQRDRFGETFGSGSGMAMIPEAWRRDGDGFAGELLLLPDRGYNVEGTIDYRARINRIWFRFAPQPSGAATDATGRLTLALVDTMLLTDGAGQPMTGLDPESVRAAEGGLPPLPVARNGRVSVDPEAVVRFPDGSLLVGDEYGPNIYRFTASGRLVSATAPPAALTPMRRGRPDYSSDNPAPGGPHPSPKNPETGRQNNQGLEGLALSPDRKTVTAVLQSATRQDGGDDPATRRFTRALVYDATNPDALALMTEVVVPLPVFPNEAGKPRVAAQSELLALGDGRYLLLCRDSGAGYGLERAQSLYRRIELLDIAGATNIAGSAFDGTTPVAPRGVLDPAVKPATLTPVIDLNDNAQLARFGLHSGPPNDHHNLSEKWEAMGLVPALDPAAPEDWFLFVANDNDFITQDGFQAGASYKDASGAEVDTVVLVYRVTLPGTPN